MPATDLDARSCLFGAFDPDHGVRTSWEDRPGRDGDGGSRDDGAVEWSTRSRFTDDGQHRGAVHNVGRDQAPFLKVYGEKVVPALKWPASSNSAQIGVKTAN